MGETVKSVAEMLEEEPGLDRTATFDRLWALSNDLTDRINARFELTPDASSEEWHSYGEAPGYRGSVKTFTGPEMDWFVHSNVGDPEQSFTNIHVTSWLGPHVKVPHLGFAFGTLPRTWAYIDFIPRADLAVDLDHLDTYFEPLNEQWLETKTNPNFDFFVSKSLYVRTVISEVTFAFSMDDTEENLSTVERLATDALDRWLGWVDEAPPVPEDERAALAARDLAVRRNTAERDPANVLVAQFFDEDTMHRLVSELWGGHRTTPRPHE